MSVRAAAGPRPLGLAFVLLLAWAPSAASLGALGPVGTVTAVATQTRLYNSQVAVSYLEAVNCTLDFDEEVENFGPAAISRDSTTKVVGFQTATRSKYQFQLLSTISGNITIYVAAGAVKSLAGSRPNAGTTAPFSFQFYTSAPSVMLRLDELPAGSTNKVSNVAYLIFNSTTSFNGAAYINQSVVRGSPGVVIEGFSAVDERTYRFTLKVAPNSSAAAAKIGCNDTAAVPPDFTSFRCSSCEAPQSCSSRTRAPPAAAGLRLEFPLQLTVGPAQALALGATPLPLLYDTLAATVSLDAPEYAREPFFITVRWSEPMRDVAASKLIFDASGPPIDQVTLEQSRTVLNTTSFRQLISPTRSGVVGITINGTQQTMDLAGNANDFRRNAAVRTGARRVIIYSAGPPLEGTLSFDYTSSSTVVVGDESQQSLLVSWSGFVTAVRYDLWVSWGVGSGLSSPMAANLTSSSFRLNNFTAQLGVEYRVHLRAWNLWGEALSVNQLFLHPPVSVVANGSFPTVRLPDLLSQLNTNVSLHVLIPTSAFLSINPTEVLSFRTINKTSGDPDPCESNTPQMRCTQQNFHIEVPDASFVVFRRPIRLRIAYGLQGWSEPFFRPQLRYWEDLGGEWREAFGSCPPDQAFESWDTEDNVYVVAICHLTQFAVFESLLPSAAAVAAQAEPRSGSYQNPVFFAGLAGVIVAVALACGAGILACYRPKLLPWRNVNHRDLGIRPVTVRLPSRRRSDVGVLTDLGQPPAAAPEDDVRQLLNPESEPMAPPRTSLPLLVGELRPLGRPTSSAVGGEAAASETLPGTPDL